MLLLIKDHDGVFELKTAVFSVLKRDSIELIICSRLVIMSPYTALLPENLHDFDLLLQKVRIVA